MRGDEMTMYRKKPVVIEAIQWLPPDDDRSGVLEHRLFDKIKALGNGMDVAYAPDGTLLIMTLEGVMCANHGDWVIRGVEGELYPCKPHIFAATYEAVE